MAELGVIGSGPAVRSVVGLIEESNHTIVQLDAMPSESIDRLVCVGPVGASVFEEIHAAGITEWISVELGGIGGRNVPDITTGVTVFGQGHGCYACLQGRVSSSHPDATQTGSTSVPVGTAWIAGAVAGNLAIRSLETATAGTIVTLPYTERRLFPMPFCDCHDSSDPTLEFDEGTLDLETITSQVEPAIDPVVGLLSSIGEAHSFPLAYYLATVADTTPFSDATAPDQAAGAAASWTSAFMKATGEALERYGAACYQIDSFTHSNESSLAEPVSPTDFVLPEQSESYDPSESILWIQGVDLSSHSPVFIPAEFVVFPPPQQRFRPAITTGLGLGSSTVDALLAGVYEVIERDAIMIGWYSSFEPLEVTFEDDRIETLRNRAQAENLTVTVLLMTQDVDVPVVTACVYREAEWPQFAVGSNAHLDATTAGVGAVEEALQNWMELRAMGKSRAKEEHSNIAEYASFPEPAREFLSVRRSIAADTISPTEPLAGRQELEEIVERTSAHDLGVYASRLTTRDLERVGVEVTRVLVPSAQPLFLGDGYFGDRARMVPAELGFESTPDAPGHPYP